MFGRRLLIKLVNVHMLQQSPFEYHKNCKTHRKCVFHLCLQILFQTLFTLINMSWDIFEIHGETSECVSIFEPLLTRSEICWLILLKLLLLLQLPYPRSTIASLVALLNPSLPCATYHQLMIPYLLYVILHIIFPPSLRYSLGFVSGVSWLGIFSWFLLKAPLSNYMKIYSAVLKLFNA
jgi:hypothetical protein